MARGICGGSRDGFEWPLAAFPALCWIFPGAISTHTLPSMNSSPELGAPLSPATHGTSTAEWELPVAGPCRSSGPSTVATSSCWVGQRLRSESGHPGLTCAGGNRTISAGLGQGWRAGSGCQGRVRSDVSLSLLGKAEPLQQEVCEEVPDCWGEVQGAPAHRFLSQDGDEAGHRAGGERGHRQDPLCCLHCLHPVSSTAMATPCSDQAWAQAKPFLLLGLPWPAQCHSESCLSVQEHQPQDSPCGAHPSSPLQGQRGGDPENPSQQPAEDQAEGKVSPGTVPAPCASMWVARTHQKPMKPAGPFTPSIPALIPLMFLAWLFLLSRLFLLGWC